MGTKGYLSGKEDAGRVGVVGDGTFVMSVEEEVICLEVELDSYLGFNCTRCSSGEVQKPVQGQVDVASTESEGQEEGVFSSMESCRYLFLSQGLQLFGLALPVVFHDHHGGVDFAHRQVCGC